MKRELLTDRKRTRLPVIIKRVRGEVKKYTFNEITDDLTNTQKADLLRIATDIQANTINIKKDIYNIGEALHEAKKILLHGMFIPWIEQTFRDDLPYNTARFYMKVYETFEGDPRSLQYIPTKYLIMIISNQFHPEVLKLLKENPEKISNQKLQTINENYTLFKEGKIGNSQFLKLSEEQIKLGIDIWKGRTKHRLNTNMRHSFNYGASDILQRIIAVTQTAENMKWIYPPDPESEEHKELINTIHKSIKGLQELERAVEGKSGIFRTISTEDGDKSIPNI